MHGRALRTPALLVLAAAVALLASAVTLTLLPSAAAQPWPMCDDTTGNYSAGSAYANNIQRLIYNLKSNAFSTPALFATGSAGAGADAVYGLILCRGNSVPSDCYDCGTNAGQDVYLVCNNTRDAALVYNQCYVRISPTDFLAATNNTGIVALNRGESVPAGVDVAAYDGAVTRLLNATVRYAVDSSAPSSSPRKYFATGHMVGVDPHLPTGMWTMAQCAGDISPAQCGSCLYELLAQWWDQFDRKETGARLDGSRCNLRYEVANFYNGSPMVRLQINGEVAAPAPAPSTDAVPGNTGGAGSSRRTVRNTAVLVSVPVALTLLLLFLLLAVYICKNRTTNKGYEGHEEMRSSETLQYDLGTLRAATNNFSEENMLGRGGFGPVYKGTMQNGQEIAVKRLSTISQQGFVEMKNEIVLVSKLQHKNLVRLLGFCIDEEEKLLVYEFLSNKSLNKILFDPATQQQLSWEQRYKIIEGISRGLLYLHEDSRLTIIHRDLKPGNILLDADMNPKISDFGLAKLFKIESSAENTRHIAGTSGYMAPEYAYGGIFSTKSDVFSYGILVLEIVTGRRAFEDLLSLVWRHWSLGSVLQLLDGYPGEEPDRQEMLRCIHIGLLCVQEDPQLRPHMASVLLMLRNRIITMSAPTKPAFVVPIEKPMETAGEPSINKVSVSDLEAR